MIPPIVVPINLLNPAADVSRLVFLMQIIAAILAKNLSCLLNSKDKTIQIATAIVVLIALKPILYSFISMLKIT